MNSGHTLRYYKGTFYCLAKKEGVQTNSIKKPYQAKEPEKQHRRPCYRTNFRDWLSKNDLDCLPVTEIIHKCTEIDFSAGWIIDFSSVIFDTSRHPTTTPRILTSIILQFDKIICLYQGTRSMIIATSIEEAFSTNSLHITMQHPPTLSAISRETGS